MLPQFLCFLPPHQGLQLRRETILYLLQAFMRQDSHAHQLMGGQRCSCDRASQVQVLQGKLAGQCRTCVHPPACSSPSPPASAQWLGTTVPAQGSAWVQAATSATTTAQRMEQQLRQGAAALIGSLRGDDAWKWSHLLESKPSSSPCLSSQTESRSTQVMGNQRGELTVLWR